MHHIRSKILLAFIAFSLLAVLRLQAQVEFNTTEERKGPNFHVDLVNTAISPTSTMSRLSVYLEVFFDDLQFVKTDDTFQAAYEVTVTIFDQDNDQSDGAIWKEKTSATSYDMTNERGRISQSNRSFELDPGEYKIKIGVQDVETHLTTTRDFKIMLRRFDQKALLSSDIVMISELRQDSTGSIAIRPQVSDASKGILDSTMAFMEIYAIERPQDIHVKYELFGSTTRTRVRRAFTQTLNAWRNPVFFHLPADSLPHDLYQLTVDIEGAADKLRMKKSFYVRWSALPSTASNLETAIEQLRYIAAKEEWKRLRKAKGDARLQEFKAFWQRHDPTPGTEANEAMEAFYSRVEYANLRFSVMHMPGWRTDMGVLFIILGSPDDVERNVYPRNMKPYEIWTYYDLNRQFLFFDYTGFGDSRLETPISIYEIQRLLHN